MDAYRSWGRLDFGRQKAVRLHHRFADLAAVAKQGPLLPFGNGRSYGDVCQAADGLLIDCRGLDRFIAFDRERGILRCEAGVLLSDILRVIVPAGWFLSVTPGTQYVTVGGAIANDVHGKNHHRAGTFGCHVRRFELLRSDGRRLQCSREENKDLFRATIGGLGLTGVVVWAEIQLRPIANAAIVQEVIRFPSLDGFFSVSRGSDVDFEYTIAWIDCLARGRNLGRGLFMRGNHGTDKDGLVQRRGKALAIPLTPPFSLVNGASLRVFNTVYYRWRRRDHSAAVTHYEPFFYPLDAIRDWNRMYGAKGFFQYQCVLPRPQAENGIPKMLEAIARARQGSFLAVLKEFGDRPSPGLLSFPRPGLTLALDFPNRGRATRALLDALDDITLSHGGAVYPAKDARMSREMFEHSFPGFAAFTAHMDPAFSSSLWQRVRGTNR